MPTLDLSLSVFYYLRHGQTDANLQGVMCGSGWDIELNATGLAQAEAAARILRHHLPEVGTICASPLRRARKTAEIVAAAYEGAPLQVLEDLREWDMGSWSRRPFAEVREAFLGSGEPEEGESRAELRARALRALRKAQAHASPLLLVGHGGLWMALQEALSIPATRTDNGVPYRVKRSGGIWQAERLEDK